MTGETIKWPKLKRDRVGMKAELTEDVSTSNIKVPKGTIVTIESWHNGAYVITAPCTCCGVRVYITQIKTESTLNPIAYKKEGDTDGQ